MKTVNVKIKGVEPGLLMHRFAEEGDALPGASKERHRVTPTPEEEAEKAAYRDPETKELYVPGECVFQALVRAASRFQIKGGGKLTYKDLVKGGTLVQPDFILLGITDYEIDRRPVRIQRARVMRSRPYIRNWSLTFDLSILDDDAIPLEVMHDILEKAGAAVGILDYRPRYGRFILTRFE